MNKTATIYHNPRCSKSRQTLAILEQAGMDTKVIEYLQTPPNKKRLRELISILDIQAHDVLRTKESAYKQCGLSPKSTSSEIIEAIAENPILLERPIVVIGQAAAIGRPPENVRQIL